MLWSVVPLAIFLKFLSCANVLSVNAKLLFFALYRSFFQQYGLVLSKFKNVASVLFFPFFGLFHLLRFFQLCLLLTKGKPSLLSQCLPHCSHGTQLLALSFLPSFCPFWFWSSFFWLWERREGRSWVFLWAKLYFYICISFTISLAPWFSLIIISLSSSSSLFFLGAPPPTPSVDIA